MAVLYSYGMCDALDEFCLSEPINESVDRARQLYKNISMLFLFPVILR